MEDVEIKNSLKFKGIWRDYQQRILNELNRYLDDSKLNIVAAPGAGKTTLGIEVLSRLNKPALILVPTITIRNQWKQRIIDAFISNKDDEKIISTNIKNITPITIITYQLLHSIMKNEKLEKVFIKNLIKNKIETVILDEAHHLRTEWYKSLDSLCDEIESKDFKTVSLTGTPPYDVSPVEWQNYHQLCGPVDAEISIPELVKQGDLCKHQDLVWFSVINNDEKSIVEEFNTNRKKLYDYIKEDSDFMYSIKNSKFMTDLEDNIDLIYENTEFTISLISFLLMCDDMDMSAITILNFLELKRKNIPHFDYLQAEILLNGIIGKYEKHFKNIPKIKGYLKELNLLETPHKVDLLGNQLSKKIFSRSSSKIQSIKDITEIEYSTMKNSLREVVLLDYIGRENQNGINILSVFEKLKNNKFKIGILTGSLIVIPACVKDTLYEIITKSGIDASNVLTADFVENYLRVEVYGNIDIVSIITELFNKGAINVLIGTQALLGEGWDSPCVNSLIIASVVGSFMLSNQMRGRAIRVDKNNLNKTSNIWHLVSIAENQYNDYEAIKRRFNTFEGISFVDNTIQNGIERLGISEKDVIKLNVKRINQEQFNRARERELIVKKWQQVFEGSSITENNLTSNLISNLPMVHKAEAVLSNIYDVLQFDKLEIPKMMVNNRESWLFKNALIPWYINYKISKCYKTKIELLKAIIGVLWDLGLIKTNPEKIEVKKFVSYDFIPYVTILNSSNYERKLILDIVTEMFSKPANQRYILRNETSYITVPDCIGTKQARVKLFYRAIKPFLGEYEIIFTKNEIGRKKMLSVKFNSRIDNSIKTARIWI